MKRLEKLLVYVDDLETLDGIIEMVAEIVSGTACRVVFASVVEPVPWGISQAAGIDADGWVAAQSKELEEGINDSVAALQQRGFDVQVKVYAGETTRTLVNAVIDDGFDVLIKAAGEDGGPLGRSNDQRILRHCPCPVAILRPPRADRSQIIMAAVEMNPDDPDDNEINDEIMDAAIRTAMGYFRQLVVVHAWHLHGESMLAHGIARLSTERLEQLRLGEQRRHQDWLQGYVRGYIRRLGPEAARYLAPETRLIKGPPVKALVEQVERERPELLVLGSVARTGIQGLLIGNTAESLASAAGCSTLTVKPGGFRSPLTR